MQNTLDAAMFWYMQGVAVFPLKPKEKTPFSSWTPYQTTLPTPDDLVRWFCGTPCNLAVVTGWAGLTVLDFDMHKPGDPDYYTTWRAVVCPPETYEVVTGQGRHVYYWLDRPTPSLNLAWVEVKSGGRYVVGEPSIHPSGRVYTGNGRPIARVRDLAALAPDGLMSCTKAAQQSPGARAAVAAPTATPKPAAVATGDAWQVASNPPPDYPPSERVKAAFRVLDYFPQAQRSSADGRWWVTYCPFHDDQNPSFWIDASANTCGCLAGCTSKPLDVINLHARLNHLTDGAAIRDLVRRLQ